MKENFAGHSTSEGFVCASCNFTGNCFSSDVFSSLFFCLVIILWPTEGTHNITQQVLFSGEVTDSGLQLTLKLHLVLALMFAV